MDSQASYKSKDYIGLIKRSGINLHCIEKSGRNLVGSFLRPASFQTLRLRAKGLWKIETMAADIGTRKRKMGERSGRKAAAAPGKWPSVKAKPNLQINRIKETDLFTVCFQFRSCGNRPVFLDFVTVSWSINAFLWPVKAPTSVEGHPKFITWLMPISSAELQGGKIDYSLGIRDEYWAWGLVAIVFLCLPRWIFEIKFFKELYKINRRQDCSL